MNQKKLVKKEGSLLEEQYNPDVLIRYCKTMLNDIGKQHPFSIKKRIEVYRNLYKLKKIKRYYQGKVLNRSLPHRIYRTLWQIEAEMWLK